MPGPTMIFTTKIGAMGAAGAFAAAYVNTKLPNSNQDRTLRNQEMGSNPIKHITAVTSKKKPRVGRHRNDLHVLMFVMSKD